MNQEVATRVFATFAAACRSGDFSDFGALLTDDAELEFFGSTRAAGVFRGKATVLKWFSQVGKLFPNGISFDVRAMAYGPTGIFVEWRDQAELFDGDHYVNHGVSVFSLTDDGYIRGYREYVDTEVIRAAVERRAGGTGGAGKR